MSSSPVQTSVDTTKFDAAFARYMEMTSKTLQRACNDKLFDIARFALKDTVKASPATIKATLSAGSDIDPNVSLAELLVIMKNRKEGNKVYDLKKEAKTLTNRRVGAAGHTRSGWIKPMIELMPYIGKSSLSVGGVSKNVGPGGATPIKRPASIMTGAVWNDVSAKTNESLVQAIKEKGAQSAVDKVTADMEAYMERKLAKHNEEFNK